MSDAGRPVRLKALVVDDSPFNRRSIADILSNSPEVEVVGHAADGEEALRLVTQLKPDVVTLDLEMPRMDGFTLLRILMSRMPLPVIVVSSYSQRENVFKALELGALDFVAKPDRLLDPDLETLRAVLLAKVALVRGMLKPTARRVPERGPTPAPQRLPPAVGAPAEPRKIVAIAASTGGPSALMDVFSRFPRDYPHAVLVCQHMPENFTRTFAERLDRHSELRVAEAKDLDLVHAGSAFVCPGRQCMELESTPRGFRLRLRPPNQTDRYVPSADALFESVAKAAGARGVGAVLTGMGDDGTRGSKSLVEAGGVVVAESEATAIVYGMPGAVVRARLAKKTLRLLDLADYLQTL